MRFEDDGYDSASRLCAERKLEQHQYQAINRGVYHRTRPCTQRDQTPQPQDDRENSETFGIEVSQLGTSLYGWWKDDRCITFIYFFLFLGLSLYKRGLIDLPKECLELLANGSIRLKSINLHKVENITTNGICHIIKNTNLSFLNFNGISGWDIRTLAPYCCKFIICFNLFFFFLFY